mmetsp:Transcript_23924/g.20913  ORF Transcript_23924/g.20913 Transcript_23924/m.20913 type:complete len:505 (-) Transcript_23924:87-1601(-)
MDQLPFVISLGYIFHLSSSALPAPKLLYDFQDGSLGEGISGNSAYDLFVDPNGIGGGNNAQIVNGVLRCDGIGDYVLSEQNLDFDIVSHSFEVLAVIDNLASSGGGAMAIDSNYDVSGNYQHNQQDSIVYNEIANNRKWFLGSEYFRRTQTSGGITAESQTGQFLQLVAVYDVENNRAKLYRNGIEEMNYVPANGFFTAIANSGVRILFCQRHYNAGGMDFAGRIRYGAYYDRALTQAEVQSSYTEKIGTIPSGQAEIVGNQLQPDIKLTSGQGLRSSNSEYIAVMQSDGNFVIYQDGVNTPIFHTNTALAPETENYAVLQSSDGNLVVYNIDGSIKYSAGISSNGDPVKFLRMRDDGNLVAYKQTSCGVIPYYGTNGIPSGESSTCSPTAQPTANTPSPTDVTSVPSASPTMAPTTPTQSPPSCKTSWQQCGGNDYSGSTCCIAGYECFYENDWWSHCKPLPPSGTCAGWWQKCGGIGHTGFTCCDPGSTCTYYNNWWSQCDP